MSLNLTDVLRTLVTGLHILSNHNVLDAYGHVSVRNPEDNATFWMPANIPPALVSSRDDLVKYYVDNASAVDPNARQGYIERYIHSEIYKHYPGVVSVVHSHAEGVLPYCISGVPLRPTLHTVGFLGDPVPMWNIESAYSGQTNNDLLVRDQSLGANLAAAFGSSNSDQLAQTVVLMENHGFTTVADGIKKAIFQAVYTQEAAEVLSTGLEIRSAYLANYFKGRYGWDHDHWNGANISAEINQQVGDDIRYLTADERTDSWVSIQGTIDRPWSLWTREVEINPLYKNNI